jgi:hypothetical protein
MHSLTLALDRGEWSSSCPGRFTPRERATQYTLDRRLGEPQSWSGPDVKEKNSQPPQGVLVYLYRKKFYEVSVMPPFLKMIQSI